MDEKEKKPKRSKPRRTQEEVIRATKAITEARIQEALVLIRSGVVGHDAATQLAKRWGISTRRAGDRVSEAWGRITASIALSKEEIRSWVAEKYFKLACSKNCAESIPALKGIRDVFGLDAPREFKTYTSQPLTQLPDGDQLLKTLGIDPKTLKSNTEQNSTTEQK